MHEHRLCCDDVRVSLQAIKSQAAKRKRIEQDNAHASHGQKKCIKCAKWRDGDEFLGRARCSLCTKRVALYANKPQIKLKKLKFGAHTRSYDVLIDDDELLDLFAKDCFYCGHHSHEGYTNGIDRVDNAKGYVPGNCVACCGTCNKAKYALDGRTFIERACHVSAHHGGIGAKYTECWSEPARAYRMKYTENSAKKRNLSFELTEDEFDAVTGRKSTCTYCGRNPANGKRHGIDRLDISKGYVLDNCVTACGDCNIAKGTRSASDFIEHCKAIAARAPTLWDQLPADMPRNVHIRKQRQQPSRQQPGRRRQQQQTEQAAAQVQQLQPIGSPAKTTTPAKRQPEPEPEFESESEPEPQFESEDSDSEESDDDEIEYDDHSSDESEPEESEPDESEPEESEPEESDYDRPPPKQAKRAAPKPQPKSKPRPKSKPQPKSSSKKSRK